MDYTRRDLLRMTASTAAATPGFADHGRLPRTLGAAFDEVTEGK